LPPSRRCKDNFTRAIVHARPLSRSKAGRTGGWLTACTTCDRLREQHSRTTAGRGVRACKVWSPPGLCQHLEGSRKKPAHALMCVSVSRNSHEKNGMHGSGRIIPEAAYRTCAAHGPDTAICEACAGCGVPGWILASRLVLTGGAGALGRTRPGRKLGTVRQTRVGLGECSRSQRSTVRMPRRR